MAKRWKTKFTIFPSSIQLCRSKDLSSFPVNPVPAIYRLSPVNSKAHHKQPTSPEQCRDKEIKKAKSKGRKSTSSVPSRRSEFLIDSINEQESETLISCLSRFSDDEKVRYSGTLGHKNTENQDLIDMNRRKISSIQKVQRVRFQSSTLENRKGTETTVLSKSNSTVSSVTRNGKEEKVKESFVVAKKSTDPFDDFKKSMKEVIAEMEIFEAKDLEQLLQRFLALNSRSYHGVIVRAFMEIWQEMFVWNPKSVENHQKDVS